MASEENRAARPSAPRIFLIHATPLAIAAINDSFRKLWPEAGLANLLDDSLSPDLQRAGKIDRSLTDRFLKLATYARDAGADGIIFTCSAFGPAINACKEALPIPVLRPNEAMVEEALAHGDRSRLVHTCKEHLELLDMIEANRLQQAADFLREHIDYERRIKVPLTRKNAAA